VRAPLSWLRDFAPFEGDPKELAAALDDLGLVVEGVEVIGERLDDIVVARVTEISAIEGKDRIRRVLVDAGADPVEIVCGATNFAVDDLVPLAPVGAVLPVALPSRCARWGASPRTACCVRGASSVSTMTLTGSCSSPTSKGRAGPAAHRGDGHRARRGLRHHCRGQPARRMVDGGRGP